MDKLKLYCRESWLLLVAAFVFGLLLAVTNSALRDRIESNESSSLNAKMGQLIEGSEKFEMVADDADIAGDGMKVLTDIFKAVDGDSKVVGYGFTAVGSGFADKIKLVIAVDRKFEKFLGYRVLSSNETPGFGSKIMEDYYRGQYVGAPAESLDLSKTGDPKAIDAQIVAISGATVSSDAVVKIFNSYTDRVKEYMKSKGILSNGN